MKKFIATLGLGLSISFSAQASLIGDSVEAVFSSDFGGTIDTQFDSPAVVDLNTEFAGAYTDVFGKDWKFSVDFSENQFVLRVMSSMDWANVFMGENYLSIIKFNFSDLDWGFPVNTATLTDYSCVSTGFSCDVRNLIGEANVNLLNVSDHEIQLGLNGLYHGETYTFTVDHRHSVPEPTPLVLLLAGLVGLGIRRVVFNQR